MGLLNRLANSSNPYQGAYKKVLCVCSAGLLRSPTAAWVLSQEPFNFNTRAAGLDKEFALIPVDEVLLEWCDEVVCMNKQQAADIRRMNSEVDIKVLGIPDNYAYRDPELIELIKKNYKDLEVMEKAQRKIDNDLDEQA